MDKSTDAIMIKKPDTVTEKVANDQEFKNHNPNSTHNTKKESCGPNTKR